MYHSFFIHSPVNGHLGCFHALTAANSPAMNNGIHVSFSTWFPQGICLGVGCLGHMVVLFLVFKGISIPSSIVAASIYIPTNSTEHSRFSITIFELEFWNFLGVRVKWKGAVLTIGNERPLFTHHSRNCLLTGFLPANLTPISSLLSLLQPDTHLGNLNLILSREDLVC